jgi:hypothetical protein
MSTCNLPLGRYRSMVGFLSACSSCRLYLVLALVSLGSCMEYPPFDRVVDVERVVVIKDGGTLSVVDDSTRVRKVVEFANARLSGWRESYGFPDVDFEVRMYGAPHNGNYGGAYKGSFGYSGSRFVIQRQGVWVVKHAGRAELDSFKVLTGLK